MIGDRVIRAAHHALVIVLVVASVVALSAQAVVDPQFVEFTPSADHSTLASDGTPIVQRYSLTFYPVGSSVAFDTMDLGKPTPSAGIIRVDFLPLRHTVPTPGVSYEARVTAIGPGGSTASAVSNGFSFQGACAPSLSSAGQSVGAGPSTGSVGVTAATGCAWTAVSNNTSWLTVTGGASGSGNGTVTFSATSNPNTSARTGTITIAGQTFTVTQAAAACTFALVPTNQSVAAGGGTGSTSVTALAGCAWTAVSNNTGWLTVTSGASGNGAGTVGFSATANPNGTVRSGTLTIAGQTFTVNQAAAACTYSLSPVSQSVVAGGGTGSTGVTAPTGCAWTGVSNNTSWLTVTTGASGSGNGTVAFSASSNPNTNPRTGTLTIGGQTFSVTQAAAACTYSLLPVSQSVVAGGGTGTTTVTTLAGCAWTGVSNNTSWLTVTSGASGSGTGTVAFSAAANPNTSSRTGTLTIAGQTFTVTQAAAPCTYSLAPSSQVVVAGGGTGSTAVTSPAGCAWTGVSNNTSWLTVTSGASGSGNGTVAFSAAANASISPRTGTLTIGGRTFTVTQAAAACTYALAPTSQSVVAGGGTGSTTVTTLAGCAWTGDSFDTSWLTVTSGASGTGTGTVAFSAAANTTTGSRIGTLSIAGQMFTVTQPPCTYSLAPTSQSVVAAGGTGSTAVTAPDGCPWTGVSNNPSWLTVTSGASGSGTGAVAFSAAVNPNPSPRTGTLSVGGQIFSVTQAAASCTYSLAPTSQSVVAGGGTGSTAVTAPAGCTWTGVSNDTSWLTVTSGASGSGIGTVAFSAASNPNTSARTGTLTIGGQTFSVTQAAAACTYALLPTSQSVVAAGGTGSTTVTTLAGCAWTGVSNDTAWLTVTSGASGTGTGTVGFSAAANPNTSSRTGTLTIAGQTFTVSQAASSCTYSLAPTSQSVVAGGGTGSTAVTAPAGCAWTGVSNNTSWLTVTTGASGSGNGTVAFSASSNPNTSARTGTLTVGGQTFTVTQAAAACTYAIAPTSQSVVAGGGTGSTAVTAPAGCAWTGVSNNTSWLTVTSGASGSGNGTVAFTSASNPNTSARTGTLTIGGQTFTVTQAAASCTYAIAPTSQSVVAAGGTGSTAVTAPAGCAWTGVSNDTSWLTVTSGASGSGNGTVAFSASSNPNTSARTGTLTIGGQTFTVTQAAAACTYAIAPTSQSVVAAGGTGSTAVTAPAGCAWTGVSNNTSWLTVTSGASGSGNGTVAFSAAANPNTSARTGTLTIGGQTFTVTQAAASCTYSLAPTSQSVVAGGGTGSTAVTAPAGCAWTGKSNDKPWLTVTSGATGSGNGTVAFSAAANPSTSPRTGTLTIGGQTFTVTQAAASCTYAITPTSQSVVAAGGTGSTAVTAAAGCAWTGVSNDTAWLTVTSGASGSGNGTVAFSAASNPNTSSRTGTLTIAGHAFTVTQLAAACTYAIAPTSQSVVASGGTGSTAVTAPAGCTWTSVSNATSWLTVTSGVSGSGNGTVAFSASSNPNTSPRTGTITIAGQTFTVNQAAAACTYAIAPTSQSIVAGGGTGSTSVTTLAGCAWTGVSNDTGWLTVTSGASGSGAGTVAFSATANPNTSVRTGTITIAGQTFTVNQAAAACTYAISPSSQSVVAGGGTGSTAVTAPTGCAWTGVSNATSWLTVTSGASGSGNGTVAFSASSNPNTSPRTGTLTIGGQTFTVTQAAASCTYALAPTSQSVVAAGGTGSTAVTTPAGCAWTGVSNDTGWLTVTSGASGSGNGTVAFSATANPNGTPRSGTLTIGGQTFTVNQAAVGCTYSLLPTSQSVVAGGGTGSTAVTAPTGCAWTGVSNATSWLTVTSGASGSGNGTVAFSASSNPNTSPRTGTITIGGQTFSVNQAAASCTYALVPTSQSVTASGGTGSTTVTTLAGCAWTGVSNDTSWLTVTSGASGSGNGTVAFSASSNPNTSPRTGTLTIGGQTFSVNQAAAACTYALVPTSQSVTAGGGTGSTSVTTLAGCAWTGVSNNTSWLTVTSGASGSGNGTVAFSASSNPNTSPRTGTITIGGQTFSVNQAAASCTYALVPTSQSVTASGGTGSTSVTTLAGCAWTGVSNDTSWLTVTSGASGSGNGTVAFSASSNPNTSPRSGTLTIGGQTFSVNQAAAACTYALVPTSQSVTAGGGTGSTSVTTLAGCAWTGVSNNTSWLTVTSGASGSGNGTVAFSASSNPNTSPRTGTITIGGQTFSVNQAAASCTYALVPTSQSVTASGGTGSTTVTTLAGCAWTGVSNDTSWLTVTSGASGSGNGTVAFSASSNPNTSPRTGTLTIGGQTFSVTQAAASCTYALAPTSQSVVATGGTGSTVVTAPAGCAWTGVSNNTSWLTVTSGASGSGNGTVAFSASSNPNTSPRTGTITIGGQTFSVNQAAASCTYALVPTSQSVTASGGTGSTSVTTLAGCAWTGVSNDTSWLTVTSGATGSGGGTVGFSAAANATATPRSGTLTIGGQTFTVTQAAAPCTYSLAPTSQSVAAGGANGSTAVTAPTGCAWTGVSNDTSWLTVTSGASGSGNGTVAFSAAANGSTTLRSGTLTIGGQTFTVTQAAAPCTYSLAPTSQSVAAGGANGSTAVTAPTGCAWTGVSNDTSWLTVTSGATGSGNGTVAFSAAANAGSSQRSGTITIGGQTFTVTQSPAGCTFSVSPSSQSVPAAGDSGSASVTTTTGCTWTSVSNATWITVTAGATGSGSGSASFTVAPSTIAAVRTGTLTIAGNTFNVSQAANTCSYVLTPTSTTLTSTGGSGSIGVATASGCTWVASTTQPWISVSGTGTASGTATYTVQPNTGASRVGAVSIGTQVFTVIQNGATTGCTYSISPASQSVAAVGGSGLTTVTTQAGCPWLGVSNDPGWLTLTSGATGTGGGSASFNAAANTATSPRTGTMTIANQTFTVTQAAAPCSFAISPSSQSVPAAGGNASTTVTTTTGCAWTAVSNVTWITVTAGASGSGNGSASFTVAPSTTSSVRTGTLTIAGRTFTVTQAANTCSYTLTPTSISLGASGGAGNIGVATGSGCTWLASTTQTWITVSGTGTTSGTATYTVQPNTGGSRVGAVSIGTQVFTVIQAAGTTSPLVPAVSAPRSLRIVVGGK